MKNVIFWNHDLNQEYITNLDNLTLSTLDASKSKTKYFAYFPGSSGGVQISEGEYERLFELIYDGYER